MPHNPTQPSEPSPVEPASGPSTATAISTGSNRTYFPALDGIRAIAVMIVVVAHGSVRLWPQDVRLRSGWVGVQIFFVLSGFLITYLLLAEKQRTSRISLKDFYIRRGLRIWPLYYGMLALYAFVLPRLDSTSFSGVFIGIDSPDFEGYRSALWPHVVFLQNYLVDVADVRLGLGVYWSLAVEEHFYLVWPLLVVLFSRKALPWLLGLTVVGSAASSILYDLRVLPFQPGYGELTHNNLFAIAAGCLVGYAWAFHAETITALGNRAVRSASAVAWIIIGLVVVNGSAMVDLTLIPGPNTVAKLLVVASSAILIVGIISRPTDHKFRLLSLPHTVHIGRISYGIYLTHALVLGAFARSASLWNDSVLGAVAGMVIFAWLAVVVADFIYRRFEAPILLVKKRFQRF